MPFSEAVLPITPEGRVYHLDLLPHELADTIITVGDRARVARVSRHFDKIEYKVQHREFLTHTGILKGKRLSVISTGIGPSNIDIVLNELDALKNIDFQTRKKTDEKKQLTIVRFGTTGGLQESTPLGTVVVTERAIGLDGILHYYQRELSVTENKMETALKQHMGEMPIKPYVAIGDAGLAKLFSPLGPGGITITCPGFYGPQDRLLRIPLKYNNLIEKIAGFSFDNSQVLNFEMETATILGLGGLLGHRCLSIAVVLAHRLNETFSQNPDLLVEEMIEQGLQLLVTL
jgi:uridine phosphorylase